MTTSSSFSSKMDKKLSSRFKDKLKIQVEDEDVADWDQLRDSFQEHFHPQVISQFRRRVGGGGGGGAGGGKQNPLCLYSDLFCDGTTVLCGFDDGTCKILDLSTLTNDAITLDRKADWAHNGLSSIRCSRTSPSLFFTSSSTEGVINGWDAREQKRKPCQTFCPEAQVDEVCSPSKGGSKPKMKPILTFDVSCNDQLVCGGTEKVSEDSYLMFWDVRSTKLLGAYWESHSDDVTAVRFHPTQVHSLASGSTDGLLNAFNLMEPEEDESLQFSFNTNSSIDSIYWHCPKENEAKVACVMHTNEFQVWDAITGDRVAEFNRKSIADAMLRRNPDSVYITNCYGLTDVSRVGLMTCPLSGGNTRLIDLNEDMKLSPRGLFFDQTAIVQTAQSLSLGHKWITFDENRMVKVWATDSEGPNKKGNLTKSKEILREERRSKKRPKPYERD